jgi:hypothetical protein
MRRGCGIRAGHSLSIAEKYIDTLLAREECSAPVSPRNGELIDRLGLIERMERYVLEQREALDPGLPHHENYPRCQHDSNNEHDECLL